MYSRTIHYLVAVAISLWLSGCEPHNEKVKGECVNSTDSTAKIQVVYGSFLPAESSPDSTLTYTYSEDKTGLVTENTCKKDSNKIFAGLSGSGFPTKMYSEATDSVKYAGCQYAFSAPHQCEGGTVIATAVDIPEYDAALSDLTLSSGNLTPGFTVVNKNYTVTVPYATSIIKVTPTVRTSGATVKVKGQVVSSGSASSNINLSVGSNSIPLEVTSSNGEKTYSYLLSVTRSQSSNANLYYIFGTSLLSPAFNSDVLSYSMTLPESTDKVSIRLYAVLKSGSAEVTLADIPIPYNKYVDFYQIDNHPVRIGENILNFLVTAPDGVTTKTYTINVIRGHALSADANLSGLNLSEGNLSPVFSSAVTSYSVTVPNTVTNIQVTPTVSESHATVTVNGTATSSGSASSPISLVVGSNSIPIVVTAENGTSTKTYTVNVTRKSPISSSAYLSNLVSSSGSLTPTFNSRTYEYNLSISRSNFVIFTPTAESPNATIRVNGQITGSGQESQPIPLYQNEWNTVGILVTPEEAGDTRHYVIRVYWDGSIRR